VLYLIPHPSIMPAYRIPFWLREMDECYRREIAEIIHSHFPTQMRKKLQIKIKEKWDEMRMGVSTNKSFTTPIVSPIPKEI
jgi:uncharacterized protein (DUF2249 family)